MQHWNRLGGKCVFSSTIVITLTLHLAGCSSPEYDRELGDSGRDEATNSGFHRELRGARTHELTFQAHESAQNLLRGALDEMPPELVRLTFDDFYLHKDVPDSAVPDLRIVHLVQQMDGVPISGAFVRLLSREQTTTSQLVASSHHVFTDVTVNTETSVDREEAVRLALSSLRLGRAPTPESKLGIYEFEGVLRLAWEITVPGAPQSARVLANGESAGYVFLRNEHVTIDGTIQGHVPFWWCSWRIW